MQEYVIECFNTEVHEFEYLRISAISAKEAIEHFKIQFGKQQNRFGRKKYIYWNVQQIPESEVQKCVI